MWPRPCPILLQMDDWLPAVPQRSRQAAHSAYVSHAGCVCTADTKAEEQPEAKKPAKEEGTIGGANGEAKQEGTAAEKESAATADDDSSKPTVVEEGRVTFWYRPKVERKEAHSVDDIQRCVHVL